MKLTLDEQELLEDIITSPGMKPLWKEAEAALELIQQDVIKYTLTSANHMDLVILKAKAEGAAHLLLALKTRLDKSRFPKPKIE